MKLRDYGWLLWTTFLVGTIGGILAGLLVVPLHIYVSSGSELLAAVLTNALSGMTISVVSMMGLFAYLTLNYLALTFEKGPGLWRNIQVFLVLFAFFDMIYLRYTAQVRGDSFWTYWIEPLLLLAVSLIVAYFKVKATNPKAWIPTVFFMFAVSAVEWVPALRADDPRQVILMGLPLLMCNTWQVMQLHRVTKPKADPV